ncbi:hypothetical protein [Kineococcus sp. SYSU DK004]|uniref:hypothetical protein n=1 Tax=Kineococcus sp. SYSU DK004 TaxID=3383125 RepID=UPI003D7E0CB5
MKELSRGVLAAVVTTLVLTGCSATDPCTQLPAPTREQVATAAQQVRGLTVEVEVEVSGVDCFVDPATRRWTQELEEDS